MKNNAKLLGIIVLLLNILLLSNTTYAIKPNNNVPIVPEVIEITEYSITLKKIEGYEYKFAENNYWQNSNVFSFLKPDTTYYFVQRIKETEDYEYSSNSQVLEVKTKALSSESVNIVPDGYIPIRNLEDLQNVKNDLSAKYILMNDIICDTSMEPFEPIGNEDNWFTGIFNGNNYSIIGIKQQNATDLGLFGYNEGIIINLNVIDTNYQISENGEIIKTIGNIAGWNSGGIIGCSCKNQIIIDKEIVLGGNKSLKDNYSYYRDEVNVGGIAGINHGKIYYCNYDGKIEITTKEQYSSIGGIVGFNWGNIVYCYNLADVISNNGFCSSVGGICGENTYSDAYIGYTYNTGNISNINSYVGAYSNYGSVGGLVGTLKSNLYYSYSLGIVKAERAYSSALYGYKSSISGNNYIYGCYSMYGNERPGSTIENGCYYINSFIETSLSQGMTDFVNKYNIQNDEIIVNGNNNYPFPISKKLGMIDIENNYIDYDGGNGLINNPFRLSNKEQLKNMSKNPYAYFILENDIILNKNESFEPIEYFYGVLDGNNYKIYNLNVTENDEYAGLIKNNNGRILNLNIANPRRF